jgi:hypothetical protein
MTQDRSPKAGADQPQGEDTNVRRFVPRIVPRIPHPAPEKDVAFARDALARSGRGALDDDDPGPSAA